MNTQTKTKIYMLVILAIGFSCLAAALLHFPFHKLDYKFLILVVLTIGLGSRITVQIPRFKSHISVSDTFIFLALLLYGGEAAIVLAAVEAFFSAWRFCNKKFTVFFNSAIMSLSTTLVVVLLYALGLYTKNQSPAQDGNLSDFILALSVMALAQFIFNTTLSSIYGSLKSEKPLWETWKTKYIWTFSTYIVGAVGAGAMLQAIERIGFGVVAAVFPIVFFLYLTYRMYLKNVEMSLAQAEQAEQHAEILKQQAEALRESEERFRSAFNHAPIGIALVSPSGNWLKVNGALCEILGYKEEEFLTMDFQSMLFAEDLGETLVKIHELFSEQAHTCQLEQRYIHKTGKIVWAAWSVSTAGKIRSERPNLIFQIQDITEKKLAEKKLQHEASHDALTGLPNRAYFMSRLESALLKAGETVSHKVSLLFIDLDRFKIVNDSLGHLIGDQLLVGIADRLRDCLRPADFIARLGGDEFIILVEGNHQPNEIIRIAERIREKFASPFDLNGHEIYSSASIGILHHSEKHLTPADLMRDADTAMYQAKRAGKARHEVFDERMHRAAKEVLQLENDLRRAVERKELIAYYQPIHSLDDGRILGFEALARWNHPELGVLMPNKFIPLAEEIGLIDMVGERILHLSCSQMQELREDSTEKLPFMLSVNLSSKQFEHPDLVENIKKILEETRFPPDRLKLEITESVFFNYRERAVEMLHQLLQIGIEINIDDFGTGYSNLSYLMQLPISTLKIDRSFIEPLREGGGKTAIIQTIMTLAQNLGMKVIAEGVETSVQVEQLKRFNCESAQGFYFSEPMAFEKARQFYNEQIKINIPERAFDDIPTFSTIQ